MAACAAASATMLELHELIPDSAVELFFAGKALYVDWLVAVFICFKLHVNKRKENEAKTQFYSELAY